jgi:hypothetical protein
MPRISLRWVSRPAMVIVLAMVAMPITAVLPAAAAPVSQASLTPPATPTVPGLFRQDAAPGNRHHPRWSPLRV